MRNNKTPSKVDTIKQLRDRVLEVAGVDIGLVECKRLVEMVEGYFTTERLAMELENLRKENTRLRQELRRHSYGKK